MRASAPRRPGSSPREQLGLIVGAVPSQSSLATSASRVAMLRDFPAFSSSSPSTRNRSPKRLCGNSSRLCGSLKRARFVTGGAAIQTCAEEFFRNVASAPPCSRGVPKPASEAASQIAAFEHPGQLGSIHVQMLGFACSWVTPFAQNRLNETGDCNRVDAKACCVPVRTANCSGP
jgi:hypothetical protein